MSNIDPSGTTPGLSPNAKPEEKILNMKCRNKNCNSIQAKQINVPAGTHGRRIYRCVKCNHTWGVPVGGGFLNSL
jgi:DNA-directed RNA polymerase subunit M/transcription elongation factor TFIIS